MWHDAPPVVTALRAMLQACPAWLAAGGDHGQIHYPELLELGADAAPLPRAIIAATPHATRAFTGLSMPSHDVVIDIHAWGRRAAALVAIGANSLAIAGDHVSAIAVAAQVRVAGGDPALADWYTVADAAYSSITEHTTITTVEAVPDVAHAQACVFIGRAERLADELARELQQLATGVWIRLASAERIERPREGEVDDYDVLRITLTTGLEVSP